MLGSFPNPILYFPLKIACYSVAGWILARIYGEGINPFMFGILRVLLGFAVGILLLFPLSVLMSESEPSTDHVWMALTRIIVWAGMIWFIFERKNFAAARFIVVVLSAVLFSFAIDAIYSWASGEFPGWLVIGMC
jgi:hypothetical protein